MSQAPTVITRSRPEGWLARSLRYETRRATSVGSTAVLGACLALSATLGAVNAAVAPPGTDTSVAAVGTIMSPMSVVVLLAGCFGATAVGQELRYNVALVSTTLFRRRWELLCGKVLGIALVSVLGCAAVVALSCLGITVSGHGHQVVVAWTDPATMLGSVLRAIVVTFSYGLLGAGFAGLFQSIAAGAVAPFVLGSVLEPVLTTVLGGTGAVRYLYVFADSRLSYSGAGVTTTVDGQTVQLGVWTACACFLVFCATVALVGGRRFSRADLRPQ